MAYDLTSVLILIAGSLAGGAWLAFLFNGRISRLWMGELLLWVVALVPWVVVCWLRWPDAMLAGGVLGAASLAAVFGAERADDARACCNAARSMGASGWRVFWRV